MTGSHSFLTVLLWIHSVHDSHTLYLGFTFPRGWPKASANAGLLDFLPFRTDIYFAMRVIAVIACQSMRLLSWSHRGSRCRFCGRHPTGHVHMYTGTWPLAIGVDAVSTELPAWFYQCMKYSWNQCSRSSMHIVELKDSYVYVYNGKCPLTAWQEVTSITSRSKIDVLKMSLWEKVHKAYRTCVDAKHGSYKMRPTRSTVKVLAGALSCIGCSTHRMEYIPHGSTMTWQKVDMC